MMSEPVRIAMWSGPRNISTAMMRSFENRPDCAVWDEPLYGPYLHTTGKHHPGAEEIIANQGKDWDAVLADIQGPVPGGKTVFYQKHMTHHILPDMELDWLDSLCNCFLIRDPAEVISSYSVRRSDFDVADLGFIQQQQLFNHVRTISASIPPVLDSRDVLNNPRGILTALCEHVGITFSDAMLKWPSGSRDSDGVWAKYWYDSVWSSTGFAEYKPRKIKLTTAQQAIVDESLPAYEKLYACRLTA